jgi:RNA polymerase sigma factor (sigma-70 family)
MNEPRESEQPPSRRSFQTTHWSLVVSAAADSREALEQLCAAYWPPLYSHLRRVGFDSAEAQDLTQAFFARLLDKRLLDLADVRRGRFRTFLITALRRFVINEWKRDRAVKRGGDHSIIAADFGAVEKAVCSEPAHDLTPERLFERQWALSVLQNAFRELELEQRAAGSESLFETLARCLSRDASLPSYDALAKQLQTTPEALKMRVSRMRKRLGELVRAEIRKTVDGDADVDDELRTLYRSLSS